jgi:superfamily II DNA or RNA helicase
MRRNFNANERRILYQAAGGRCELCGRELHGIFHADHVKPYSAGGKTDVINGQALCPECNRMKSYHDRWLTEWTLQLRSWQERAFQAYLAKGQRDFLLVATPAAGKTCFCLRIAHMHLMHGTAEQIVIVVHTDNLRQQWIEAAAQVGIHLQSVYDATFELAPDMHGIVTTYQTVAARLDTDKSYRKYTARRKTFVILDECHHAGDGLTWGDAIRNAFEPATLRLSTTGTPFRSDKKEIPFVNYIHEDGRWVCQPDFSYQYGDALRDGVVRHVFFSDL